MASKNDPVQPKDTDYGSHESTRRRLSTNQYAHTRPVTLTMHPTAALVPVCQHNSHVWLFQCKRRPRNHHSSAALEKQEEDERVCGSVRRRCVGTECGGEYSGSRPTISPSDSAVRQKCQTNAQNRNYYQTLGGQTQVTLDTKKIASINKSLQRLTIWK